MDANRYASALATVLRGAAVPYGYTLTVWTSGMVLTREGGIPSVADVFLFIGGAVAAFAVLGATVRLSGGIAFDPARGVLRRTGALNFIAVGAAAGAAALVSLIHTRVAWPLGAFAATTTYLVLTTVELSWQAAR